MGNKSVQIQGPDAYDSNWKRASLEPGSWIGGLGSTERVFAEHRQGEIKDYLDAKAVDCGLELVFSGQGSIRRMHGRSHARNLVSQSRYIHQGSFSTYLFGDSESKHGLSTRPLS